MYPEDSIQSCLNSWWINEPGGICRGRLVWAFLPHTDQIPMELDTTGRLEATAHDRATFKIIPLRIGEARKLPPLPVAAMPVFPGERRGVYRVKKRPAIVLSSEVPKIPDELRRDQPKSQTSPTAIVAPFYGADKDGSRAGFREEFVKRVRRCEYPQYMWDSLPLGGPNDSILRVDHLQPVGLHYFSLECTPFRLSDEALIVIDEWLNWFLSGAFDVDSILGDFREELLSMD